MERLLTVEETARALKVPKSWIYGRIHTQALPFPFVKIGRYVRIPEEAVRQYIQRATIVPQGDDHLNIEGG